MSLYPALTDAYYVDDDQDIKKYAEYCYEKNIVINQSYWSEADIDLRFICGDQTIMSEVFGNLPLFRKRQFSFNRIKRIINMITGYQRQHRKSTAVTPLHTQNQATADQFTKLIYHVNTHGNILETISEAFEGAVGVGMNLLATYMDYRTDPVNGDIKVDNVAYNSYMIDSYFKKADLSDCNFIRTRKFLSRNQVKTLLPGMDDDINNLSGLGNRDGKFQFMPESYGYAQQDLILYDEFWYQSTRKQKMLVDVQSGECTEWRGHDEDLADFLHFYPEIMVIDQEIPTVKLAVMVQGKVMYHGQNPLGIDRYPFVPVWAYYEPNLPYYPWRIQGVARQLRDAQYLYNRRRCIELDILESQINSGFIYIEDALINQKDIFMAGQGKGLACRRGTNIATDVVPIQAPQIPPSMIQLSELLGQELNQISGVNEELLGAADDDKAGILSMLRQGAGLTTLQVLFDHLDQAQKLLGKIHLEMIQANWTPGKVRLITEEEPSQEFYNRAFGKYDAIVEEVPLTSTQKQLALQQKLYLREMGIPIPIESIMEEANFQGKDKLIKQMQQQEQAQQKQQEMMAQLQMQQMQVDNETKISYAEGQKALAAERINKTRLDAALSAERIKRADEDRTGAILNLVKAAKEIQSMDIEQLERAINIAKTIGAEEEEIQGPKTQQTQPQMTNM
jgi:hypothetical protein